MNQKNKVQNSALSKRWNSMQMSLTVIGRRGLAIWTKELSFAFLDIISFQFFLTKTKRGNKKANRQEKLENKWNEVKNSNSLEQKIAHNPENKGLSFSLFPALFVSICGVEEIHDDWLKHNKNALFFCVLQGFCSTSGKKLQKKQLCVLWQKVLNKAKEWEKNKKRNEKTTQLSQKKTTCCPQTAKTKTKKFLSHTKVFFGKKSKKQKTQQH